MEKKKIVAIFLMILIIISSISIYCFIRSNLTIKAIIVECYENSINVFDINKEEYISIGLPKSINLKFKPGQEVRIYIANNTLITYSYPKSISSIFIKRIKIIKEDGNPQIVEEYNTIRQERLLEFEKIDNQLQELNK